MSRSKNSIRGKMTIKIKSRCDVKNRNNVRLALFVATVATDSALLVATLPVSERFWSSLLFYFGIEIGSCGTLPRCARSRTLFGL